MEEESAPRGGIEGVGKLPSAAPAFFVILTPSQGDGSKEEGILVANRDVSSVAPVISTGSDKSKSDFFLSSNCTSGEITVTLDNNNMWNEFYRCNTEMVLTKQGRRMFPYCRYWISGLNPYLKYILVMDITPLDNQRYKWNGKWWEPAGKADPHVLGRVFLHPESPSTGQYWMHQPVSFYKLKLTNNILDQEGHIILHSMHRYLPRLHVVPAEKSPEVIQLNGPDVHTFTFPQTEFIAVTAYQNFQITQLKIDCNPFAKGFREGTVPGRPVKDLKHKPSEQEVDASCSKNVEENEDPDRMKKLQQLFKMSEYLDGDKENDIFNSVRDFLKLTESTPVLDKDTKPNEDVLKRFAEHSSTASLSKPTEQPSVEIKKEPEDDYDYSKTSAIEGVAVKQEQSDAEDADVDYPILEKHFAKFKEDPYLDGNHSSDSPTGVAKAKLLELDQGNMCLEPCAADNNLEAPDLPKPVLPEDALQDMDTQDSTLRTESPPICPSPSVNSQVGSDISVKEKRKRICKNKIDEIYATLQTALRTSRGPKRKCPLLFPKPPVTSTPGNEGTVAPIPKKRGRPPKPKISKVGRPAKKDNPIEAPRLFPDFNPDLEDVDGVLFVAFSSKEALDVHTANKPPDAEPSSLSTPEANTELTEEMQKILGLETQLLTHLKTMKYRQVIHPALQQVGLKLNIVDPAMSIDLRYLGVELPLLSATSDTNHDDSGLSAQGWPFVSRTGKTTDYTKIKGWRDKFSTEPATSSQKNEAGRKNLSAFCSDELDEYLENEAKLMGDLKELTWHKPESSISYQLPTKSSSYVRTLDSVLKKQAQQAMSSVNAPEQFPVPRKKRKYTRRVPISKPDSKARPIIPAPVTVKEKSTKPHSVLKKDHSASHFLNKVPSTPSSSAECLSKSQPVVKPSEDEQSGSVQQDLVASGEGNLFLNLQTQQALKPIGFSKAQMKLLELEECAVWEGKPRTYITKERADLSLSTLLTAQASLRNKPIQKLVNKRTDLCNKDFCRLGCICSSLSLTKHAAAHCRHETCMFSCDCLKNKHSGKDGLKDETTQGQSETAFSPVPGCGYQPVQAEQTVKSPEARQTEEHQEMTVDGSAKAKKRKFNEGHDRKSNVRTPVPFPIWNRSDVADDPEPLCVPEQAEFVEPKILHKEHAVKGKSPGGGKVGRPSSVAKVHPEDPMYLYLNSTLTCARVRAYQPKAPEEKKMKDQSICGSDTPVKEHNLKSSKAREQEKDANKEDEFVKKKCEAMNNNGPTKLIDIISDCSREEDDSKVSNITSQRMTSREPQTFKVGSFNVELKQENGIGEKATSGTFCSRVKIAVSAEKQSNSDPPNPRPVKWQAENAKPSEEPDEKPADIEAKSHGGKGLPFYTKVIPAGKLVARLKTSDANQAELVEVNGKNHSQAKLLLGQMGALHPANRLAAYVTHRLQPNLSHFSKVNEASAKMATKSPSSDVITEDKSKDILPSQQNKTAAQSRPSSTLTQSVMGDDGSVQKSPGVSSSEPTILGSPKLSIQSTRLIFVSSTVAAGKQSITTTTSSSVNLPSLSTIPLSSAGLSTLSPSRKKATPSLPTLMRVTKLITKGSSLSIPAGIVAATDARAMTLTSVPSTKDTVLTPPILSSPLVKSSPTTGNRSSISPSNNPGVNKSIATSLPNLVLSPNVPRLGSVAGLNITSPVTVKTVSSSSVPALNPSKVTSGPGKRLGPRLLLIPVNSSSSPARPVQCVQSSPGQKMVLQPIKTTSGVTLFRHPNGQIIQLVPLQQVQSSSVQPSRQQVIIRNPGPVMGVRLPLLTKSEASASTSVSIPSTTVPPVSPSSSLPVLSPSKTSPNKSGTAIFPQNPPMLSQLGSLAVKASPPKRNCEASLSLPKVITYTGGERSVITSKVMPLLSAGLSLPNVPPPPLQNNSPANAATKPNLTLMGNKPGITSDPTEEDKKISDSSSPVKYGSSGEKGDKEVVKECDGQPTPEIFNDGNGSEVQKSTNQQIKSVTQEVDTISKEEQCQNGQQDKGHCQPSNASINELFASNVDLLQEPSKKDAQGVLMRRDQGPAGNGDSQQCIADNTNSQAKIGDSSPVTFASAEHVASGVEQNLLCKTGEKAELSIEQKSAKSQDSVSSSDQNNCESLQVDPQAKDVSKSIDSKETISDNQEIQRNLETEEESDVDSVDIETVEQLSDMIAGAKTYAAAVTLKDKCGTQGKVCENDSKSEVDEYVDIETVEALSEKMHLAHLKESAHLNKDMCDTQGKSSKARKKGSKMTGEDIMSEALDEGCNIFQRKNHTANERKRRSELRDLFEELRNALGLHNLPKVSKMLILKQAIEEIENLTDTADTLIKKKTLLSQTQAQLIKKVSNLSGKPREVVLKKLEYLYAKQKAVETEQQKKNLEEDVALDKASINLPLPKQEAFFPLTLQEETNDTPSAKTKKPIILTRKAVLPPKEGNQLQPGVPLTTSNVLIAPTGHTGKPEHGVAGQVAGIPPTLIQADLSPVQIQSGMASVVIQLPSAIKLKGVIGNNPVPIALSTVPGNVSTTSSFGPVSDEDDLAMMPKIVNVTSLALGAKSDTGMKMGISGTEKQWKSDACSLTTEAYARGNAPAQDTSDVTAESCVPSASVPVDKTKEVVADPARKSCSPSSSLHENLPQENDSGNTEASLQTKDVSVSITPPTETVDDTRGSRLDLELKKLTSAIDEAGLDPTELPDTMGDPEEADETLTSLLNEIAFLSQQLNSDGDALEPVNDFPGPDTVSHSDASKSADADSSSFSFGRFKDGPETKEKNISFSPLFMQLEEGEIRDSSKLNEGAGIAVFAGGARKEPPLTEAAGTPIGRLQPPAIAPIHQRTDESAGLCSDVFWRPMPKLAPLGLKSHTLPSDQRVLASKPMPSLASVAMRLSSPKTTD